MKKEIRNAIEDFKAMAFILAHGKDVFIHEQSAPSSPQDRMESAAYMFATASNCTLGQAMDIFNEVHESLSGGRSAESIISAISAVETEMITCLDCRLQSQSYGGHTCCFCGSGGVETANVYISKEGKIDEFANKNISPKLK